MEGHWASESTPSLTFSQQHELQRPQGWTSAEVAQAILASGQLSVAIAALFFGNYHQIRAFLLRRRAQQAQQGDEEAGDAQGLVPGVQDIYRRFVDGVVVFWVKCWDVARDLFEVVMVWIGYI
ncbi:hypothetical protein BDD12DRAFT_910345 [Trichophaea hybrida]|nr:hypothetical protein BDD12DRAFT_910345 [Trichophaea hybrida]